jgi:hypothetical protein
MSRRRNPVDVLKSLRDAGFVTDDAVKKLDAPRVVKLATGSGVSRMERPEGATSDALDELHEDLEKLRQAYRGGNLNKTDLSEAVRNAVYQWLDIEIYINENMLDNLICKEE